MDGTLMKFIPEDCEKSFDMWVAGTIFQTFHDSFVEEEMIETSLEVAPVTRHDLSCSYSKADPKRRDIDWTEMCNMTSL